MAANVPGEIVTETKDRGNTHMFYLHAVIPYRRLALTRRPGTNLEGWVSSGARSTIIIKIPVKKPSWSSHTWKEAIRC